jgi:hypothetical protein
MSKQDSNLAELDRLEAKLEAAAETHRLAQVEFRKISAKLGPKENRRRRRNHLPPVRVKTATKSGQSLTLRTTVLIDGVILALLRFG